MPKYKVEIIETLSRTVEIEAENEFEAEDIVRDMYRKCEIVLEADDYVETNFETTAIA